MSVEVVSCCVVEMTKLLGQCIKDNSQICLTIGPIHTFIFFYFQAFCVNHCPKQKIQCEYTHIHIIHNIHIVLSTLIG